MNVRTAATLALALEPEGAATAVRVSYLEFTGEQSNPIGAPTRVDTDDIDGDLVFTVDARGRPTIVSKPEVTANAGRLANPTLLAQTLFPRLPDRVVKPGDSWTDTVRVETQEAGWRVAAMYALTYTLRGDTVVNGESLLHITGEGDAEYVAAGVSTGFNTEQSLSGTVVEDILWNAAESSLVRRRSQKNLTGDLEASGFGVLSMTWSETNSTARSVP